MNKQFVNKRSFSIIMNIMTKINKVRYNKKTCILLFMHASTTSCHARRLECTPSCMIMFFFLNNYYVDIRLEILHVSRQLIYRNIIILFQGFLSKYSQSSQTLFIFIRQLPTLYLGYIFLLLAIYLVATYVIFGDILNCSKNYICLLFQAGS